MEIHFCSEHLRILFCDKYYKDEKIGVKATHSYRTVVNYLFSVNQINDLHHAQFLDFTPQAPYSIKIDHKHRLQIEIIGEQIHLVRIEKT